MSLTISLPRHIQEYIEQQVAEGRFDTESAVIADAVRQVMDEYRWENDPDLLEAIAEADRGEGEEYTPELHRRIREEAEENVRLGKPVPYDVTY